MAKSSAKPKRSGKLAKSAAADLAGELSAGLQRYRDKRDPGRTNEPFTAERTTSAAPTRSGRFVVHQHDATRMHFDVRLQLGDALMSFAVPKGPSLDPGEKRLAIRTENHPLEYLEFEDVIPDGNYGAGPMVVWDTGRVIYLENNAEDGLAAGKLDFELYGFKLRGRFAFVETGKRAAAAGGEATPHWLLLKKTDAFSRPGSDVVGEDPRSVLSGLTLAELMEKQALAAELEADAARCGAQRRPVDVRSLTPMLCATSGAELDEADRYYELKLDGVRIVADRQGDDVVLRYRNGRPAHANYPEIARAVRLLPGRRLVLDGEIIAFDAQGRPSFQKLATRIQAMRPRDIQRAELETPVIFMVFDLLAIGEHDLRELPLSERKRLLMRLIRGKGRIRALDHLRSDGRPLFEMCRSERLEGVVAKRASAPYRPGPKRYEDWVKIKCERDDEFVVVGWVEGRNSRKALGALDLASYDDDGQLVLRGKAGSGLDQDMLEHLFKVLKDSEIPKQAYTGELPYEQFKRHFVEPKLVASVRYLGWSDEGRLRFPVFRGLREDVELEDCRAAPAREVLNKPVATSAASASDEPAVEDERLPPPSVARLAPRVVLTNQDKVFWPDEGYTKGDVCNYYASVAEVLLPFLKDRPVVLVRYPDGITGKSFFQWNAPKGTPDWMKTLRLMKEDGGGHDRKRSVFLIPNTDALLHIANLGAIPLHVLGSRATSLAECDFLTIDFDIGDRPFKNAVLLALFTKQLLDAIGLEGFPKTSGQKGLHVLVPLGPGVSFEAARLMVELLGRIIVAHNPEISTMERRVSDRADKVYVDTGQTGRARTIVAPYSVRAYPGATVSTPLSWDEVHLALDPRRFTMFSVPSRVASVGDPMAELLERRPNVQLAIQELEQKFKRTLG